MPKMVRILGKTYGISLVGQFPFLIIEKYVKTNVRVVERDHTIHKAPLKGTIPFGVFNSKLGPTKRED